MTPGAWVYLIVVWSIIIAVNVFCFSRIFGKKKGG